MDSLSVLKNKPEIRFEGFDEAWGRKRLGELVTITTGKLDANAAKADGKYAFFTCGKEMLKTDTYSFKGDAILVNGNGDLGFTRKYSGYFNAYQRTYVLQGFSINYEYVEQAIHRYLPERIKSESLGGAMPYIKLDTLAGLIVPVPDLSEADKVSSLFNDMNRLIILQQRKCDRLQALKKAMLEKMFPKAGSDVPEIRFAGFTDAWEQRKFADVVQIERGGSPRPIDDYITDSPNGLNWVKIGDAPSQGHYITKTAERIRPQGLSKTREVHPGDLILSNSMSFGKPYIMGIDGCIHDGWLLIRDTNNTFDLTFLCHLLGTPQMLDQYRSLAAGSTVNNLNKELVGNTVVTIPKIDEQRVLGQYLERLDNLITLHQRKLQKLQECKKALLEKMFVSQP